GHGPAGDDGIDANAMLAEVLRQRAGHAMHGGLVAGIGGQFAEHDHPAYRAEIDDRAAAGGDHAGRYRLGGEEVMPEVDCDTRVPEFGRHILDPVTLVVGSVVDQCQSRSVRVLESLDRVAIGLDVSDVAWREAYRMAGFRQLVL